MCKTILCTFFNIFQKYEGYYTSSIQLVPEYFLEGLFSSEFRVVAGIKRSLTRTQREIQKKKTLKKLFQAPSSESESALGQEKPIFLALSELFVPLLKCPSNTFGA